MFIYIDCYGFYNIININSIIFNYNFDIKIIYKYLIYYKNNLRIGSRSQKNRSKSNFSTRKLHKQKGTGMARVGDASSPTRVKGALSFPSKSFESFNYQFNKKCYKIFIYIVFSKLIAEKKFYLIDDLFFVNISAKYFKYKIKNYANTDFVILLIKTNYKFYLSQRNFFNHKIMNLCTLNPFILLKYDFILFSLSSLKYFKNS